jgi:hypothetical protein
LFAPVTFRHNFPVWGFVHRPSIVFNTRRLTDSLFVNGPQGCYCFGDYFGASWAQAGIFPGFAFHMSSLGYDPFFATSSFAHCRDVGWHEQLVADYRALRDDARLRPPRTFGDVVAHRGNPGEETESLALPFERFAARGGPSSLRFVKVSQTERNQIERSLRFSRGLEKRRFEFETRLSRRESINREGKAAENRDRRESRFENTRRDSKLEDRRDSRFADTRRDAKNTDGGRDSKLEEGRDSKVEDRRDSKLSDTTRDSKVVNDREKPRESSAGRTPPVVSRRPVSTAGLAQHVIRENPDQRLANPKFVPQPANRGRSKPAEKGNTSRRH